MATEQSKVENFGRIYIQRNAQDDQYVDFSVALPYQNFSSSFVPLDAKPYIWVNTQNRDSLVVALAKPDLDMYIVGSNSGEQLMVMSKSPSLDDYQIEAAMDWFADQHFDIDKITVVYRSCT